MPSMAELVWAKQEAAVQASAGLIVPSPRMREVIQRCYPECPPEKIHVLPWGNWHSTEAADPGAVAALRAEFAVPQDAQVLLTLSRISPEKGQDLLLESLIEWERGGGVPTRPLYLFICGQAAFMQGQKHMARLEQLAAKLKHVRVVFPGHVTGARKRAFFGLADLYVFPSRHESYGLTLMEAMACGLASVCSDTHGARSVMRAEFGEIVGHRELAGTVMGLLADDGKRREMAAAARKFAEEDRFSGHAAELARCMQSACIMQ
jgi:glycosyltransferase involved in cell wall biosynthesis